MTSDGGIQGSEQQKFVWRWVHNCIIQCNVLIAGKYIWDRIRLKRPYSQPSGKIFYHLFSDARINFHQNLAAI